jgi:hypothetical protein
MDPQRSRTVSFAVRFIVAAVWLLALVLGIQATSIPVIAMVLAVAAVWVPISHRVLRGDWICLALPLVVGAAVFAVAHWLTRSKTSAKVVVTLSNVDDQGEVDLDGRRKAIAGYQDHVSVPLGDLSSKHRVQAVFSNKTSGYAWRVRFKLGKRTVFCEEAGHAGKPGQGAFDNDMNHTGVVRRLTFDGTGRVIDSWIVSVPNAVGPHRC